MRFGEGGETASGKTVDFGGIEMNLVAVIETKLWEGTVGSAFYTENEVQRETTYTYYAGTMVYELISPDQEIYRMQSYSQLIDPELTIDDLATLGERLELPEGWSYEARILEAEEFMVADGLALVINDELGNSYQKSVGEGVVVASNVTPALNGTGIYTTVTGFEHADAGRTHQFESATFGGSMTDPSNNDVSIRIAPEVYPGAYNIVTRDRNELFVYFGVYGENEASTGPTVARLDADTLEEVWRTQIAEFSAETWNYPGALGLHGNGNLYMVGGNILASLDPDTGEILNQINLPTEDGANSSYNGFVSTADGTIFVKPIYRACDAVGGNALVECPDAQTSSVLSAINPDTLEIIVQVEVPQPVFSRLVVGNHNGQDYVYMQGVNSLFRFAWDGSALTLDDDWGFVEVLQEGQVGTAAPSITEGWLFFNTNGLPSSTTPMTLWAISTTDSSQRYDISPFADITGDSSFNISMGSFDSENSVAYLVDAGAGSSAAIAFDPATGFEMLWREDQSTIAYTMLVGPPEARVFVATNLTGAGSRINPLLSRSEQIVFRDAATGLELARTGRLDRMNGGANLVPGFDGRFYFPGSDNTLSEITVD